MTDKNKLCYPCDLCKQSFLEFFDKNTIFNIMNTEGKMEVLTFEEVLNKHFIKEDLK